MRAVLLDAPTSLLEERRRLGHDRWDEVWEGILHLVPPPSNRHQRFGTQLLVALAPIADALGLEVSYETGVYRPGPGEDDYRVPDLVLTTAEQRSERGVEGRAELIVEILSPGDESRDKLSFYAEMGTPEVWLVDPVSCDHEIYLLRGGRYHIVAADEHGITRSPALDLRLTIASGPKLRVAGAAGQVDI